MLQITDPRRVIAKHKGCRQGVKVAMVERDQEVFAGLLADGAKIAPDAYKLDESYRGWTMHVGDVCWYGECPGCGEVRFLRGKLVKGKLNPAKTCTPRCESATGPNCECACAGANHGGGWA